MPELRVVEAEIETPANTALAAPLSTTVNLLGEVDLHRVRILVPPGPSGLVGLRLRYAEVTILPFQQDRYLRADGVLLDFAVERHISSGRVVVQTFNTDRLAHTLYWWFDVEDPVRSETLFLPLLSAEAIEV